MPKVQQNPLQIPTSDSSSETSTQTPENAPENLTDETSEDRDAQIARQFLDDYVVTALLRNGRALSHAELANPAENFAPGRSALRRALENSGRVIARERDFELRLRDEANAEARVERTRRPLEATTETLLRALGKPLPLPVIVREVAGLRGVLPEAVRDGIAHILPSLRWAIPVAPNIYLHRKFVLDAGAPREELIIKENRLDADADFAAAILSVSSSTQSFAEGAPEGSLTVSAWKILNRFDRPISQKMLGFLMWREAPASFDVQKLAQMLSDRTVFYSLTGGRVTTQNQLPAVRGRVLRWLGSSASGAVQVDMAMLLRQRLAPEEIIAPQAGEIEDLAQVARLTKAPISLLNALVDTLEIEPDDSQFIPTLQGLNDALRRDSAWLPAGLGRFLLREIVPAEVGQTPAALRPIQLSIRDTETHELLDIEMSDDGLEGDCAEFIHDPQWEDVSEEVEVKMSRKLGEDATTSTRYIVLYPHWRGGTIKLRRQDEDFFEASSSLSRLQIAARDEEGSEQIGAWTSRESGLIYGLGDWYKSRTPQSGGVLEFTKDVGGSFSLQLGAPDKLMHIDAARLAELEELQERAGYLSLLDLLQTVAGAHDGGAELPTLWAEINVVRRTSKRLMCSVLSGFQSFSFKQRGPKQIVWRFEAARMDGGFKKNKRKFVRK